MQVHAAFGKVLLAMGSGSGSATESSTQKPFNPFDVNNSYIGFGLGKGDGIQNETKYKHYPKSIKLGHISPNNNRVEFSIFYTKASSKENIIFSQNSNEPYTSIVSGFEIDFIFMPEEKHTVSPYFDFGLSFYKNHDIKEKNADGSRGEGLGTKLGVGFLLEISPKFELDIAYKANYIFWDTKKTLSDSFSYAYIGLNFKYN